MGGIWKPGGRPRYRIWYKDQHGKRQTAPGYRDKQATLSKLSKLMRDEERLAEGLPVAGRESRITPLEDFITRHIADLKRQGVGPDYLVHQKGNLTRLAKWEGWDRLNQVQHAAMADALARLDAKGLSTGTVDSYRAGWKHFLNWCVEAGILEANPCARVKRTRHHKARHPKRAFTADEFRRLLETAPPSRRALYLIAGLTGLRWSELKRLEWRDVDLENNRLKLRKEATKAKRADIVPLVPDVVPAFQELPRHHLCVLPRLPTRRTVVRDFQRAGIVTPDPHGKHITFHSLRYFFCVLLAKTLPIQVVRLLMRHADISLTCKVYLDLGLEDVSQDMLKLPSLFSVHPQAQSEAKRKA